MFSLFRDLPLEVRAQIWELTFEPRLITFERVHEPHMSSTEYISPKSTPLPTAFSVCSESRERAIARYERTPIVAAKWKSFGSRTNGIEHDHRKWVTMQWNPAMDAIHVPRQSLPFAMMRLFPTFIENRSKVRTLVVSVQPEFRWDVPPSLGLVNIFSLDALNEVIYIDDKICATCVEGESECPGMDTDGCVCNPKSSHGMSQDAWKKLVEIEAIVSEWVANPWADWVTGRPLKFKVVANKDEIFTAKYDQVTKDSPFSDITKFSLHLPQR